MHYLALNFYIFLSLVFVSGGVGKCYWSPARWEKGGIMGNFVFPSWNLSMDIEQNGEKN